MRRSGSRRAAPRLGRAAGGRPVSDTEVVDRLMRAGQALEAETGPAPDFRAALRTRLMAVAAVQPPEPVRPATRPAALWAQRLRRRWAVATAGVLAGAVLAAGVVVGAGRSLPGDPLYGAKRAVEAVQLRTRSGPAEQGHFHLQLATKRLRELEALAARRALAATSGLPTAPPASGVTAGSSLDSAAQQTVEDMDEDVRAGRELVLEAWRAERAGPLMVLVAGWATQQAADLDGLLSDLPASARPRLLDSRALVVEVHDEVTGLLQGR